jgi:hypothetical protein
MTDGTPNARILAIWQEFDHLHKTAEGDSAQMVQALKLHAEVINIRMAGIEALLSMIARKP